MKKTLIASAIGLFALSAQAQLSLYGLIDASYGKSIGSDNAGQRADFHSGGDNGSGEGNSTTRVGIKGSTDVGSGTKANFKFETGGITSDGEVNPGGAFFSRAAWVGLSGTWGELRLGRQDSVPFQVMAGYDFNGASNGVASWGYAGVAPWLRGRQSRSLQYFAPASGGLSTQLGLVLKGNTAGAKDTFSGGLTYTAGALSVSGVFETKRTSNGSNFSSVAGSYDMGGIKLAAGYANGGANAKGLSLGLTTKVAGLTVGAQYARNSDTKGTAYEVFANKQVYKNTYAYVEAGHADAKTGVKGTGYAGGVIFVF